MEEKKVTKISLSTFLLIIAIIAIAIMGIYIFELQQETTIKHNSQINQNSIATNNDINQTNSNAANIDFEKLMNKLYLPKEYRSDSTTYYRMISEKEFITVTDLNENISIESTDIYLYDDEICLNINYLKDRNLENVSTTIKGIDEDIVDVTLETYEAEANPSVIVLLTRNGNVYYLKDFSNNLEAQKIDELSEIIKIDTLQKVYDESYHAEISTIAIDKDGNYIDLDKYIY